MVDAAGAIYVIGGNSQDGGGTTFRDVWASTDGGARAGLRRGGGRGGGTRGYYTSTQECYRGTLGDYRGTSGVLQTGVIKSTRGVLRGTWVY